ncbi:MAG: hypothetical protein HMLKMBBP_01275 [Planctomycetes bacterium]|nr:hypothetical protein [Planctomycetota bacterium]
MEPQQIKTFAVLGGALLLFVTERLPVDVTALLIPVALGLLGVLTPSEALGGFGNPAVVTVAAMYVLSKALIASGAVAVVGRLLRRIAGGNERRGLVAVMIVAGVCSAFINNTPVVVVLLPMVLTLSADVGAAPSRLLLPLSYGTILGGCCTLIGTSTTVLVSGELHRRQIEPLGFFEMAPVGLVLVVIGVAYVSTLGPRLLPTRRGVTTGGTGERVTEYVTEVTVLRGSPLAGRTVRDGLAVPHPELAVIEVVRGQEILWPPEPTLELREGDVVLVRGKAQDLARFDGSDGAAVMPELRGLGVRGRDVTLVELVITRSSPLIGRSVREATDRALHGSAVMAVERRGAHLRAGIASLELAEGDTLLVQTESSKVSRFRGSDDFVLLEGLHEEMTLQRKGPVVLAIVAAVILLASFEVMDISFLAMAAAVSLVLTGCLGLRQAYRAIDLSTLVLMGSTIALGAALDKSGAARLVATGLLDWVRSLPGGAHDAWFALGGVYILCNVLTAFASNSAAALLCLPIAIDAARQMGVSDRPFILAVVFAASLDFSTPTGYQTNLLVYGPGGYRFTDYLRFGGPLNLILWIAVVLLVPIFHPF